MGEACYTRAGGCHQQQSAARQGGKGGAFLCSTGGDRMRKEVGGWVILGLREAAKMPIHDWTRVTAGTWHAFHLSWISEIQLVLNGGILPADYYALAEQIAGPLGPDVLTLQETDPSPNGTAPS